MLLSPRKFVLFKSFPRCYRASDVSPYLCPTFVSRLIHSFLITIFEISLSLLLKCKYQKCVLCISQNPSTYIHIYMKYASDMGNIYRNCHKASLNPHSHVTRPTIAGSFLSIGLQLRVTKPADKFRAFLSLVHPSESSSWDRQLIAIRCLANSHNK